MSRPKNPLNVYDLFDLVTREKVKTNPQQFRELAARYGITDEELSQSYVSRNGRRKIESEKLTKEEAIAKYGIHPKVADALKCWPKPARAPRAVKEPKAETPKPEVLSTEVAPPDANLKEEILPENEIVRTAPGETVFIADMSEEEDAVTA